MLLSRLPQALAGPPGAIPPSPARERSRASAAAALVLRPRTRSRPRVAASDVLLIRRADSERDPWSGQMALPGGRSEIADSSLLATAVRETLEETGLDLAPVRCRIGPLPPSRPASPRVPPVTIWPFVFRAPAAARARVASPEVASVHWLPVRRLLDRTNRGIHLHQVRGEARSFPCIRVGGRVIWGLTYRILDRFLALAFAGAGVAPAPGGPNATVTSRRATRR